MMDRIGSFNGSYSERVSTPNSSPRTGSTSVFKKALATEQQAIEPFQFEPMQRSAPSASKPTPTADVKPQPTRLTGQVMFQAPVLMEMVDEIQQIAEQSGFLQVSPEEVLRAYHSGQSFLADYRA